MGDGCWEKLVKWTVLQKQTLGFLCLSRVELWCVEIYERVTGRGARRGGALAEQSLYDGAEVDIVVSGRGGERSGAAVVSGEERKRKLARGGGYWGERLEN